MTLLAKGKSSVPQVFFNGRLIGGAEELQRLEDEGRLDAMITACSDAPDADFPPPLRLPKPAEFLELIPVELRQKWQKELEAIDSKLGGTPEKPISSLLIMLDLASNMLVVCTSGPGSEIFAVGTTGPKGKDGGEEKLYCQVVLEQKETLFIDGPSNMLPGLENNADMVEFGYSYYVGAPYVAGPLKGTVVAMEKEPGILKEEHKAVIEGLRDTVVVDLTGLL